MEAFLIFVGLILIISMLRAFWHVTRAERTMRRIIKRYCGESP